MNTAEIMWVYALHLQPAVHSKYYRENETNIMQNPRCTCKLSSSVMALCNCKPSLRVITRWECVFGIAHDNIICSMTSLAMYTYALGVSASCSLMTCSSIILCMCLSVRVCMCMSVTELAARQMDKTNSFTPCTMCTRGTGINIFITDARDAILSKVGRLYVIMDNIYVHVHG